LVKEFWHFKEIQFFLTIVASYFEISYICPINGKYIARELWKKCEIKENTVNIYYQKEQKLLVKKDKAALKYKNH